MFWCFVFFYLKGTPLLSGQVKNLEKRKTSLYRERDSFLVVAILCLGVPGVPGFAKCLSKNSSSSSESTPLVLKSRRGVKVRKQEVEEEEEVTLQCLPTHLATCPLTCAAIIMSSFEPLPFEHFRTHTSVSLFSLFSLSASSVLIQLFG